MAGPPIDEAAMGIRPHEMIKMCACARLDSGPGDSSSHAAMVCIDMPPVSFCGAGSLMMPG